LQVKLSSTDSPAERLAELLPGTLELIAPEKVDELTQYFAELTLEVVDDRRWLWNIEPTSGLITVSYRAIEILWAVSYAYWIFYAKVANAVRPRGQETSLREDPELAAAMDLLEWAISAALSGKPWPSQTSSPAANPSTSLEFAAQQLCLGGRGLLKHHELAHKRLQHTKPTNRDASWILDAEKDADNAASDWILDRSTCPAENLIFRGISASVALLMITAFSIHRGNCDGLTHPRTFDRLFNSLSRHLEPEDDEIWGFVGSILFLHMQVMEIQPPMKEYDSHYEFVDACVEKLAQEAERWNSA